MYEWARIHVSFLSTAKSGLLINVRTCVCAHVVLSHRNLHFCLCISKHPYIHTYIAKSFGVKTLYTFSVLFLVSLHSPSFMATTHTYKRHTYKQSSDAFRTFRRQHFWGQHFQWPGWKNFEGLVLFKLSEIEIVKDVLWYN